MLLWILTSPVIFITCHVKNLYISETTIPIVPNAPKLLPTTCSLKGNHTPTANKITDTIPMGLSKFIKPVISCTPFSPPYWVLKCSQFPSCVDFTGFNCIQNCVYCYYLSFFSKIALKHRPHYFHI